VQYEQRKEYFCMFDQEPCPQEEAIYMKQSLFMNHAEECSSSTGPDFQGKKRIIISTTSRQNLDPNAVMEPTPVGQFVNCEINFVEKISLTNWINYCSPEACEDLRDWALFLLEEMKTDASLGAREDGVEAIAAMRSENDDPWNDSKLSCEQLKFYEHQNERWNERYQELKEFHAIHGKDSTLARPVNSFEC
jgi:hypothetical protein